ncbi:MAG: DUF5671 domain-containing protein [Chthoniobacterales bacterium]
MLAFPGVSVDVLTHVANSSLQSFVGECLARGSSKNDVARGLRTAGWPEREIQEALDSYVEAGLPLPVPRCRASTGPREAFLHLLLFFSLATWVIALGSLLFDLINVRFPLPGEQPAMDLGSSRFGIAAVAVAFPLFGLVLRLIRRDIAANPARGMDPIRRWLSSVALFIAVLILLGDAIGLVVTFLNGDLTVRFLLKAGVIASLAGPVVWWLQQNLHSVPGRPGSRRLLWYGICALVVAAVGAAAWLTGGPLQARLRTQDDGRVDDLRAIYQAVLLYHTEQGRLPATLEDCNNNPKTFIRTLNDRISGAPYGYTVTGKNSFVLSADFALPSQGSDDSGDYSDPQGDGFWRHQAGPQSFSIDFGARGRKATD